MTGVNASLVASRAKLQEGPRKSRDGVNRHWTKGLRGDQALSTRGGQRYDGNLGPWDPRKI